METNSTWVQSPPIFPHWLLRDLVSQTAALPAGEDETARGEPPSDRRWDSHSLQERSGRNNKNVEKWMTDRKNMNKPHQEETQRQEKIIFPNALSVYAILKLWHLTRQLHVEAQLSCDWEMWVEFGCSLQGSSMQSFVTVEPHYSHGWWREGQINPV